MIETWRPIPVPNFEGWYEASDLGRIRRSANHLPLRYGRAGQIRKPQARPSNNAPQLRPKIVLLFNYKRYSTEVGHLVALAFHGVPPVGHECNHIDGNPWNNEPDNLEWVTRSENFRHALRTGLINPPRGTHQPHAKLTDDDVRTIRASHDGCTALARRFGVCLTNIKEIRSGKNWAHVR